MTPPARRVVFCTIMKYVYLLKLWGSDISEQKTDARQSIVLLFRLFAKHVSGFIDLVACISINKWMARIDHDQITESIMQLHTHGTNWYASLLNRCALMRIQRTAMQPQPIDSIANNNNRKNRFQWIWVEQRCPVNDHDSHIMCSCNRAWWIHRIKFNSNDSNEVGARARTHTVQFSRTLAARRTYLVPLMRMPIQHLSMVHIFFSCCFVFAKYFLCFFLLLLLLLPAEWCAQFIRI